MIGNLMKAQLLAVVVALGALGAAVLQFVPSSHAPLTAEQRVHLQELRNLGKAFYENPGAQNQAVDALRKALEINPSSAQEHLNLGLALLRAGQRPRGRRRNRERPRRSTPRCRTPISTSASNSRRAGDIDRSITEFEQMPSSRPTKPRPTTTSASFTSSRTTTRGRSPNLRLTARLDPSMAAPQFQMYQHPAAKRPQKAQSRPWPISSGSKPRRRAPRSVKTWIGASTPSCTIRKSRGHRRRWKRSTTFQDQAMPARLPGSRAESPCSTRTAIANPTFWRGRVAPRHCCSTTTARCVRAEFAAPEGEMREHGPRRLQQRWFARSGLVRPERRGRARQQAGLVFGEAPDRRAREFRAGAVDRLRPRLRSRSDGRGQGQGAAAQQRRRHVPRRQRVLPVRQRITGAWRRPRANCSKTTRSIS